MRDITAQLDSYQDHLDALYPPVTPDEVYDLDLDTGPVIPRPSLRPRLVAFAATFAVIVGLGVVGFLLGGGETTGPADTVPLGPESTIPPTPTSDPSPATTTPSTPSTTATTVVTPSTAQPVPQEPVPAVPWSVEEFTSANGLPETGVAAVTVGSDGTVWTVQLEGSLIRLYRFDGTTWTQSGDPLAALDLEWVVPTASGGLLLDTDDTGSCDLAYFDGGDWTRFSEVDGKPALGNCSAQVGPDGEPWIIGLDRTADRVPVLIQLIDGQLIVHDGGEVPPSFPIAEMRLTFDIAPDGTFWYGTAEGAWSHDETDLAFYPLPAPEGCCPPSVAVDNQGQVWVQLGADVFKYAGEEWDRYTPADGLPDFDMDGAELVIIVPTSDGSVWFITDPFTVRFDGSTWRTYAAEEARRLHIPLGSFSVSVDSADGTTWVLNQRTGGFQWLYRFVDNHWEGGRLGTTHWSSESSDLVLRGFDLFNRPLVVAPNGAVWVTTSQGIARITP